MTPAEKGAEGNQHPSRNTELLPRGEGYDKPRPDCVSHLQRNHAGTESILHNTGPDLL